MELIRQYVITIVTTIIFITAIELIGPDNSMKKYLKFVMGLILIVVILKPMISFFTNGENAVKEVIDKYEQEITGSTNEEKQDTTNKEVQQESFKNNFNKNCVSILKNKYKDMDFKSDIDCNVDFINASISIDKLKVGVKSHNVKKVEKVKIGEEDKEEKEDKTLNEIKDFLSEELDLPKEKIVVYYV